MSFWFILFIFIVVLEYKLYKFFWLMEVGYAVCLIVVILAKPKAFFLYNSLFSTPKKYSSSNNFCTLLSGWTASILTSKLSLPCFTKKVSSIISPWSKTKSFFTAITGFNLLITLIIKSEFLKFLKKLKLSIMGLYISYNSCFLTVWGKE